MTDDQNPAPAESTPDAASGDPRAANPPANPLPTPSDPHVLTLMSVHAHPDDETISAGGAMAKAVADGRRVVLVTGTRGEQGEIVVPAMDTPDNHRKLGEIRMGELEAAMGELGVTEWENLGYRDSDMMGREGNSDPRTFWQADVDEAAGRLTWLIRRYQPDVVTTYNSFGGYGTPTTSASTTSRSGRSPGPATPPGIRSSSRMASCRGRPRSSTRPRSRSPSARRCARR